MDFFGSTNANSASSVHVGQHQYKIVKQISEGGFGFVYEAQQNSTGTKVALKQLNIQSQEHLIMLKNEVKYWQILSGHANICQMVGASQTQK